MSSNLTVYKNEMNTVPFRKFSSIEMDLFFSICTKMKNKNLNVVRFYFDELKELSNYTSREKNRFIKDLESVYKKMTQLSYRQENLKKIDYFVLFTGFSIDKEDEYVDIRINSELNFILNELTSSFTKFELQEFTSLVSSYSKTMFRLLKQFRLTGFYKISIEEFRRVLDIPASYRMTAINDRVLLPIEKELKPFFKNLKIRKIKARKQNKIEYLEFRFKPQDDIKKDGTKIFKDKNGKYYENNIEHFTKEEVNKSFPTSWYDLE